MSIFNIVNIRLCKIATLFNVYIPMEICSDFFLHTSWQYSGSMSIIDVLNPDFWDFFEYELAYIFEELYLTVTKYFLALQNI